MEFLTKKKAHALITRAMPKTYRANHHFSLDDLLEAVYLFVSSLPIQQMRTLFLTVEEFGEVSGAKHRQRQKEGTWFTVIESAQAMFKGPKAKKTRSSNPLANNKSKTATNLHKAFYIGEQGDFCTPLKLHFQLLLVYVVKLANAKFGEDIVLRAESETFPQAVLTAYAQLLAQEIHYIWRIPICVPAKDLNTFPYSSAEEDPKILFGCRGGKFVLEPKILEKFDALPNYIRERKEYLTNLKNNVKALTEALNETRGKVLAEEEYVERLEMEKSERDFKLEFAEMHIKGFKIATKQDMDNLLLTSRLLTRVQETLGADNVNEALKLVLAANGGTEENLADTQEGSPRSVQGSPGASPIPVVITPGASPSSNRNTPGASPRSPSSTPGASSSSGSESDSSDVSAKIGGSRNLVEVHHSVGHGKGKGGLVRYRQQEGDNQTLDKDSAEGKGHSRRDIEEEERENRNTDSGSEGAFAFNLKRKRKERPSQEANIEKIRSGTNEDSSESETEPYYDSETKKLVKPTKRRRATSQTRRSELVEYTDSEKE